MAADGGEAIFSNSDETFVPSDEIRWVAVSLTHVEYPKGNLFGLLLAWCSLLPIFALVGFATLILFRRDLHTMSYFAGLLVSEGLNYVVKHLIKEPRPKKDGRELFTEYGMPSSHAQFVSFFTVYLALFLFIRLFAGGLCGLGHGADGVAGGLVGGSRWCRTWLWSFRIAPKRVQSSIHVFDNLWKYFALLVSFALSGLVVYSRVYLLYHTTGQVVWGVACGSVLAVLWFLFVQFALTPLFPIIASWRVSEYLMVRDSTLIPNVLWFEYCSHRTEVRSRQRKRTTRKSM